MKTFVNALTIFRIIGAFTLIPLAMNQMFGAAFIVFSIAAATDFFDGYLARKYKVESKFGGVMDHMGDKFLVAIALMLLMVVWGAWACVIPSILMILRELYVSGLREWLGSMKISLPVPKPRFSIGKIKAATQFISISGLYLFLALVRTPYIYSKFMELVFYASMLCLWIAMILSIWSAVTYTIEATKKIKSVK